MEYDSKQVNANAVTLKNDVVTQQNSKYTINLVTQNGQRVTKDIHDKVFLNLFRQSVSDSDWLTAHILRQVLNIRGGTGVLLFSDGSTLLRSRDRIDPCSGSESEADSPKSVRSRSNGNRKPI